MRSLKIIFVLLTSVIFSGLVSAYGNRAELDKLANIYLDGEYARAAVKIKEYVGKYPEDSLAWTILGHAYENLDQDANAEAAYQSALKANPNTDQAITGLGILARKRGDLEQAESYYNQAIDVNPDSADAYSSLVTIAIKRGNFDRAVEYGEKGYELDPNYAVIAANLAVAYHYAGNIERRDEMTEVARMLNYRNMENLDLIYKGELDIR